MLTCERVQDDLPGYLTGETMPHDVREHLATCDACRVERDRLQRVLGAMREDLQALAPSPFLEDAVVEAARETEAVEPRRRPWLYVAVAFAAAAALFLAVLLPRWTADTGRETAPVPGEDDGEGELVHEAGSIFVPPSVGEVQKARTRNARGLALQGEALASGMAVETTLASGLELFATSDAFPSTATEAHHRFVYGDANGSPGDRAVTMWSLPSVEGVFLLGNELLEATGGTLHARGEILLGDKRWRTTPGTMQGEITVGSPDEGGAAARIRVLVSTGYSGTLLLEEPLAYALGLHQFEIPGDVGFESANGQRIPIAGHRARARIRLPELGFDQVVEVQVGRERPWMVKRGRRAREVGLLFPKLQPTSVVRGKALRGVPEGGYEVDGAHVEGHGDGLRHVEIREGTWRLFLGFEARRRGAVPLIPDVPLLGRLFDSASGMLVPRALDFSESTLHVLEVERTTLAGRWEPGANVTIGRAWRGRTAIPSAEAVVRTQVDEQGRIAFPRLAGEAGSTLRMLVRTKDGTSTFHDVVVAPELGTTPRLDLTVSAEGIVSGPGWTVALLDAAWEGDEVTGMPAPKRFAELIERLQWHAGKGAERDSDGTSQVELTIRAAPDAPFRLVQWVLMAAADPRVRIDKVEFHAQRIPARGPRAVQLPTDGGLTEKPAPRVSVRLVRRTAGGPLEIILEAPNEEPDVLAWASLAAGLRAAGSALRKDGVEPVGLLRVPPPGHVTYAETTRILDLFREAGIEDVLFEGAPLR